MSWRKFPFPQDQLHQRICKGQAQLGPGLGVKILDSGQALPFNCHVTLDKSLPFCERNSGGVISIKEAFQDQAAGVEDPGRGLEYNGGSEPRIFVHVSSRASSLGGAQTRHPAPLESCCQPHCRPSLSPDALIADPQRRGPPVSPPTHFLEKSRCPLPCGNGVPRTHWGGSPASVVGSATTSLYCFTHIPTSDDSIGPYSLHARADLGTLRLFVSCHPINGEGDNWETAPHQCSLPIAFFSSKKHFKECISFIHCCRLNGGNCLVHW